MKCIPEPFGPVYPALAGCAKYRKIADPTPAQRAAHGDAVSAAIRALQRSALDRQSSPVPPLCASGTWHNNGDGSVGAAVRSQHAAALARCPGMVRRARTPEQWRKLYAAAMAAKRAAAAKPYLIAAE